MKFAAATFLAATLTLLPAPAQSQAPGAGSMSESGVGPVRVGMNGGEIIGLGLPARMTVEHIEEETRPRIDATVRTGVVVSAVLSETVAEGAYMVSTASAAFATDNGARVGMTFEEIQRRHPGGSRKYSDEVRTALIYELPGGQAAFEFDIRNVPRGCFSSNDGCNAPGPACSIVHSACADAWIGKKAQTFVAFGQPTKKAS